jgi:hypothetical protein
VAAVAVYVCVSAFQDEEVVVIEGVDQGVTAVVTGRAIFAKQGGMIGGEIGLAGGVTIKTVD